ncbi:hypothetical protein WMW72_09510 [Paenibacillus filicis]|uniref:Lipoprotein n=1 Tax=Paenibacillus filicis TaxID=669464 RepID=A0ABU9DGY2_9BACL
MVKYPVVLMICTLLLAGCGKIEPGAHLAAGAAASDKVPAEEPAISVQGPMSVSRTELPNGHKLSVTLVKGRYFEDWTSPGPFMGKNWEGEFRLQWLNESGKEVHSLSLNAPFHTESMTFNEVFSIHTDDYNDDGNLDFVIGQYGSSNGNVYRMFTLNQTEKCIQELGLQSSHELFISSSEGRYSVPLEKTGKGAFKISYYDNAKGSTIDETYRWDRDRFVKQ